MLYTGPKDNRCTAAGGNTIRNISNSSSAHGGSRIADASKY